MKKQIILIIILILVVIGAGIYWYQNQKYQQKMIKLDACIESCPALESSIARAYYLPDPRCVASCREKYGVISERFLEWKRNNK